MAQLSSSKSISPRNGTGVLFGVVFTILSVLAVYALQVAPKQTGVGQKLEHVAETKRFVEHPMPLRATFTGIALIDMILSFLVGAFMNAVARWDESFFVFCIYFLVSFFAVIAVWAVESSRETNSRAIMRFTYVFALFYQSVGGAIIIPLYYLAYLYDTSDNSYWTKSRRVPLPNAKALLPALLIGYLLPTILMFLPYSDMWTVQGMVAFWQPCPWYVDILIWLISKVYASSSISSKIKSASHGNDDLPHLDRLYATVFGITTLAHLSLLYLLLFSTNPSYTFAKLFLHPTSHSSTQEMTLVQGIHQVFQADFWIIFASSLVWAFLVIWDVKRVGLADVNLLMAVGSIGVGTVVVGPGAVVVGVWYWREGVLAGAEGKEKVR